MPLLHATRSAWRHAATLTGTTALIAALAGPALGAPPAAFDAFVGTWVTTDCATSEDGVVDCDTWGDGSSMSLVVAAGDHPRVLFQDAFATFCELRGSPATRYVSSGVGTYEGAHLFVAFERGGCGTVTSEPIENAFYHDPGSDTLWQDEDGDGLGYIWRRATGVDS